MATKSTIGSNPLDTVIPTKAATKASRRGLAPAGTSSPRSEKPATVQKERLTVHVSKDVLEKIRNAVYWTPGLTLAGLTEDALLRAVDSLEKKRGETFPERKGQLKAGRPVK